MPRGDNLKANPRPGPGRPKGSKNKATLAAKEWAELLVEDEQHKQAFIAKWRSLKLPPHLLVYIYQLAKGKPVTPIEHSGEVSFNGAQERVKSALDRIVQDEAGEARKATR